MGVRFGVDVAVWIRTGAEVLIVVGAEVAERATSVVRVGEGVGVAVTTTVTT